MKALTIRQPWAWAIAAGHKRVENRTWTTTYRGYLMIHAARTFGPDERDDAWLIALRIGSEEGRIVELSRAGLGNVLAIARLVDVRSSLPDEHPQEKWAVNGQYHWMLDDIVPVPSPVLARGQ